MRPVACLPESRASMVFKVAYNPAGKWGYLMKRFLKPVFFVMCSLCSVLLVSACSGSSKGGVSTAELSAAEKSIADASCDIFQTYTLEKGSVYDVVFTAYRNGLEQQKLTVAKITATEDNNKLLLSAVNTGGLNYQWSLTTPQTEPGKREQFQVSNIVVDGSTVRIGGVGETGFSMEPKTSYLLYYVAYKQSNTSTSISEAPFHTWSSFTDKDALLKDFDCAYLVTITLSADAQA